MGCLPGIVKDITSNCTTSLSSGLEVEAWIFNRLDLIVDYSETQENLIVGLSNVLTKKGYKLKGVKKLLNAGHDIIVAEDRPNKYSHFFSFQGFEVEAEDITNLDDIDDVVIFVELKDKLEKINDTGEGVFVGLGVKKGLWKSADTQRANDIDGARSIEMTSMAGQEEPFSRYVLLDTSYETTKLLLEGLLV